MTVLETERLFLREWVPDDWLRFRPLATDPRALKYIGHGKPWTNEQVQQRVNQWTALGRQRGWVLWPVIHRDDARLIGFCGFSDGFPPDVKIGWRRWHFPRLVSVAQPANTASLRVMEKLGMEFEAAFLHEGLEVVRYAKANPAFRGITAKGQPGLTVRPYREADEEEAVRLWKTVFPDQPPWNVPADDIRRKLSVQRDLFLVGVIDGRAVATAMAGFDGHRGWLHLVAVHPEFQNRGIGRAMLLEAERRLRAMGCPKVNLQVRSSNDAVVSFYERCGYVAEDRVSMGKRLVGAAADSPIGL